MADKLVKLRCLSGCGVNLIPLGLRFDETDTLEVDENVALEAVERWPDGYEIVGRPRVSRKATDVPTPPRAEEGVN